MSTDDEYHLNKGVTVLHTILLIILGFCLIGTLSAVLERLFAWAIGATVAEAVHFTWGLPIFMWSRILAAVLVVWAAWTRTWTRLLIVTGVGLLIVMLHRDWEMWSERKRTKSGKTS